MKNITKKIIGSTLAFAVLTTTISRDKVVVNKKLNNSITDAMLFSLKKGIIPLPMGLKLNINKAKASEESVGDASCELIMEEARALCNAMWTEYDHGALKYFNNSLCWLNNEATANIENVLCHFDKSMGIDPDLAALPQTISKDFSTMTVQVAVTVPTEDFAIAEGYEAKGVVTVDGGDPYMILYWGGSGSESKGFLIEGASDSGLGGDRAGYTKWDLTGEVQTVQVFNTDHPSGTYLSDPTAGNRGDHAIYGSVEYNKTTDAVETQMVLIANKRGAAEDSGFGCFKMYGNGTKNGSIVISKTRDEISADNFNDNGHAVGSTALDLTDMDGAELTDSVDTANGTGNLGGATANDMQVNVETELGIAADAAVFDKSCNDLDDAEDSGVFSTAGSLVDFTHGPDDVF